MPEDNVRIRVKLGANEAEIEAPLSSLRETIELLPEIMRRIPAASPRAETPLVRETAAPIELEKAASTENVRSRLPEIKIEKDDSLTNVITKLFTDTWGKRPRKLAEVREMLDSYGLIYPKQSVAVALLRLAQGGKLRRFKDKGGEFIYTASTDLTVQPPVVPSISESLAPQPAG